MFKIIGPITSRRLVPVVMCFFFSSEKFTEVEKSDMLDHLDVKVILPV